MKYHQVLIFVITHIAGDFSETCRRLLLVEVQLRIALVCGDDEIEAPGLLQQPGDLFHRQYPTAWIAR